MAVIPTFALAEIAANFKGTNEPFVVHAGKKRSVRP